MKRRAFLRRMAAAALAGMLGARLELGTPEMAVEDPAFGWPQTTFGQFHEQLLRETLEAIRNAPAGDPHHIIVSRVMLDHVRAHLPEGS